MGSPAEEMGRYGKVYAKTWRDREFRTLSANGQRLWLYLLSCPHATSAPGLMCLPLAIAAHDLSLTVRSLRRGLQEVIARGFAEYDEATSVLWMPNALRYDPPDSSKNVLGWLKAMPLLPDCDLKARAVDALWAHPMSLGIKKPDVQAAQVTAKAGLSTDAPSHAPSDGASRKPKEGIRSPQPQPQPQPQQEPCAAPPGSLQDGIEAEFLKQRGARYRWTSLDEVESRRVMDLGVPEIVRRWGIALRRTAFPRCNSVKDLVLHINAYTTDEPGRAKDVRKGYADAQDQDWNSNAPDGLFGGGGS